MAVLYFFLNSEVQSELKKKWKKLIYHGREKLNILPSQALPIVIKIMFTGRVIDQDPRNKSTFASWSSTYSLDNACNPFMLCHTFTSRQRSESKASRKTGERFTVEPAYNEVEGNGENGSL